MRAPHASRTVEAAALIVVFLTLVLSLGMTAVHVLGLITTPGVTLVSDRCFPDLVGRRDLCQMVNVRAIHELGVPSRAPTSEAIEVSGPVQVAVTFLNPNFTERFAYQAGPIAFWLTCSAFVAAILLHLRRMRRSTASAYRTLLIALGGLVAIGGTASAVLRDWGESTLIAHAPSGYVAASNGATSVVLSLLLGGSIAAIGILHASATRLRDDVRGLV